MRFKHSWFEFECNNLNNCTIWVIAWTMITWRRSHDRARANILEVILGYFVLLQYHSDIKYRIRISDISRFCSKWVDSPTGYLDISRFCSKWVDLPTGYSDVSRFCYKYRCLVLVQYLRPSSLYQDIDFISGYLNHYEAKPDFNTKSSISGLLHDRVRLDKSFPMGPCSTSGDENSLRYDLGPHHCDCHVSTQ